MQCSSHDLGAGHALALYAPCAAARAAVSYPKGSGLQHRRHLPARHTPLIMLGLRCRWTTRR